MKTIWLPDAPPRERRLAVGEFDGVHVGHRAVIAGADSVLTFEPHPRTVVAPEAVPKLLTTLEQEDSVLRARAVTALTEFGQRLGSDQPLRDRLDGWAADLHLAQ